MRRKKTLRKAMEEVADLNEAVTRAKYRPEEERLRPLGRELSRMSGDLMMSLGWALVMSQDPSLAAGAQELFGEAEEAIPSW
jgi:hypothetical protein